MRKHMIWLLVLVMAILPTNAFVYYNIAVQGNSMSPAINNGDLVKIRLVNQTEEIQKGKVYCFKPRTAFSPSTLNPMNIYTCHRMKYYVKIYRGYDNWKNNNPFSVEYIFQGDNNSYLDESVQRTKIIYEVL